MRQVGTKENGRGGKATLSPNETVRRRCLSQGRLIAKPLGEKVNGDTDFPRCLSRFGVYDMYGQRRKFIFAEDDLQSAVCDFSCSLIGKYLRQPPTANCCCNGGLIEIHVKRWLDLHGQRESFVQETPFVAR